MRRSGHHAIMHWILTQAKTPIIHYNNVTDPSKRYNCRKMSYYTHKSNKAKIALSFENFEIPNDNKFKVIMFRDIYNYLASVYKNNSNCNIGIKPCPPQKYEIELWKDYCKLYLSNPENTVFILFNKWFEDIEYRKNICESLGIKFTDEGKQDIIYHGKGSSFDFLKYNGKAEQMNVLERYKEFLNDEFYLSLINDKELHKYNKKLFGFKL
jgi:hypothetical protein